MTITYEKTGESKTLGEGESDTIYLTDELTARAFFAKMPDLVPKVTQKNAREKLVKVLIPKGKGLKKGGEVYYAEWKIKLDQKQTRAINWMQNSSMEKTYGHRFKIRANETTTIHSKRFIGG